MCCLEMFSCIVWGPPWLWNLQPSNTVHLSPPVCAWFSAGKDNDMFCPRLNALLLQWAIAQTILVLLLSAGSPGDTVPKLAQAGWSHSMSGADSEVASRPYESIGPQRTCITLIPPKTSVSSTTTSQNGLGWRGLWRSHAPVPGLEQD